jgi:SAM-dependent methyltransferase
MNIENRLITNEDVKLIKKYRDERGLVEKYVHPNGTWRNDDATIKWTGSEIIFDKLGREGMKVVDLGAGDGPVAHMISNKGYDVVGVDVKIWPFGYQSLAVMVTKDAIEFVKEYEDNSVDIFMDGCAVTHFNDSSDENTPNKGWRSIFEALKRVMKPGGYFICFSDIQLGTETVTGEFIIPEDIVRMAEESGLTLTSEYNYSRDDRFIHSIGLGVASFVFTKL